MKKLLPLVLLLAAPVVQAKPPKISDWCTEAWMKSEMSHQEEAFRVDSTENGLVVIWAHGGATRSHINVPVGPKTAGLFHTHDDYSGPLPSDEDVKSAITSRIPVWVISAHAIWRVDQNGKVEKVADR